MLTDLRDSFSDVNFIGIRILGGRDASQFIRNHVGYTDGSYENFLKYKFFPKLLKRGNVLYCNRRFWVWSDAQSIDIVKTFEIRSNQTIIVPVLKIPTNAKSI